MCSTFLVVTVKKWLKLVYICRSYRKLKTGSHFFWNTLYSRNFTHHTTLKYIYYISYLLNLKIWSSEVGDKFWASVDRLRKKCQMY